MSEESSTPDLHISPQMRANLLSASKWSMFLAILGFVGMGIMVIFGFSFGAIMDTLSQGMPMPGFPSNMLGFIYLIFALIYFFPLLYLYRFSKFTRKAIRENDQDAIQYAFYNLSAHYTFVGILFAIVIGLYVLSGLVFLGVWMIN